jgi:hypothetical protein
MSSTESCDDNPPPGGGGKEKARRPDVSLRRKERKMIVETVVPCSLKSRLGSSFNEECRSLLHEEIDNWVITTSKVIHRLSIMFNRLLLHLLNNNIPLPPIKTALFTGLAIDGMRVSSKQSKEETYQSLIENICSNKFQVENGQYAKIERNQGDGQAITHACKRYEINFKNMFHVPFFQRQKSYIKTWLKVEGFTKIKPWEVQREINGWVIKEKKEKKKKKKKKEKTEKKEKEPLPPEVIEFIQQERLQLTPIVDETWLKQNTDKVLLYYHRIMMYYHSTGVGKKFRMAPLCQIKRHFLTIDNVVLKRILLNVRRKAEEKNITFPPEMSDAIDEKVMSMKVWKGTFNYDGLRRKRRFNHQVETDGVKVCFHFQTTHRKVNRRNKRVKHKRRKRNLDNQRVIAIDPGRSNLITAYDDGTDKFYRLTRRQYYKSSGMLTRTKRAHRRNLKCREIYEAMIKTPTRSIDDRDWDNYQSILTRHYDELWEFKTQRVWSKDALRVSCLKEKCLDRFFNRFKVEGLPEPVIAYGAAALSPTGKGELTVPVKYVYKKCYQRYKTEKEDERFTTKMHHQCRGRMWKVEVNKRWTRGLCWCPTCHKLVSRDNNASRNIMESFKSERRPTYLCGTQDSVPDQKRVKYIRGCNRTPLLGK